MLFANHAALRFFLFSTVFISTFSYRYFPSIISKDLLERCAELSIFTTFATPVIRLCFRRIRLDSTCNCLHPSFVILSSLAQLTVIDLRLSLGCRLTPPHPQRPTHQQTLAETELALKRCVARRPLLYLGARTMKSTWRRANSVRCTARSKEGTCR